jgi:hypothetical protein
VWNNSVKYGTCRLLAKEIHRGGIATHLPGTTDLPDTVLMIMLIHVKQVSELC